MAVVHREDSIKKLKEKNVQNTIDKLGQELAIEKLRNIEKDEIIDNLGQEVTKLKLDVMMLKGGGQ